MGCSMSEEQERLPLDHADMVLLMLDGDEADRKGADEIILRLGSRTWVKSVTLPEEKQPDRMAAEEIQGAAEKIKTPRWGKGEFRAVTGVRDRSFYLPTFSLYRTIQRSQKWPPVGSAPVHFGATHQAIGY
jgi:hypothetical protein